MTVVCSNSFDFTPEKPEEITAAESLQTATTDQSKTSTKSKGKKKEDETKAQEDADKLKAMAQENDDKLRTRVNDIRRLTKAQEGVKNVFVTTPDGLHVTFQHHVDLDYVDSVISTV